MAYYFIKYRRHFMTLALFMAIGTVAMLMSGCAIPTWLTDAQSILGVVGTSIATIGAFIAGLTGNAALASALAIISTWVTKVEQGITDLEELISQYNAAPTPGPLATIEATLADVTKNVQEDFGNLGLPPAILGVISGVAALALSQLEAWGSLLPAAKSAPMAVFSVKTPYTKAEYKALVNKLLTTSTGDPEVDKALAKVKKL